MRVVTASRRTDIPAFYTPWLLRRLDAGFCHTLNPISGVVTRIPLGAEDMAALGLFTRDPRPLLPHLPRLLERGYRIYAHVTLTGYPAPLEARTPAVDTSLGSIRALSEILGPESTVWRYDPIVLGAGVDEAYHLGRFAVLAAELEGAVRECYVSFIDPYRKTARNLEGVGVKDLAWAVGERHRELAHRLAAIAAERGIELRACAEQVLVADGVREGACVDPTLVERLRPGAELRWRPTRKDCGCAESIDLGAYHTCGFGCAYCYATETPELGRRNLREHDAEDTILWRPEHLRGADLEALEPVLAEGSQAQLF